MVGVVCMAVRGSTGKETLSNGILRGAQAAHPGLYCEWIFDSFKLHYAYPVSAVNRQLGDVGYHRTKIESQGGRMRKLVAALMATVFMAAMALAVPDSPTKTSSDQLFPATLRNARFVYVASYDGDQFDPRLLPEDRSAIAAVQDAIQKWGKLTLVYQPEQADIILLVQSRPSEDVLAVYDAHFASGQYLWRVMGRDGLQSGETPLVTKFEKGFESIQLTPKKMGK